MREATYILKNEERWRTFEELINNMEGADPQRLTEAYAALTDDLAFAQAQYPGRMVTQYLNQLVGKIHVVLMRTRSERLARLKWFFMRELPMAMAGVRFELKIVAVMFLFTTGIGFFGGLQSEDLARAVLGDDYVDMTIWNIKSGDPMGVYKSEPWEMFAKIGFNNVFAMLSIVAMGAIPLIGVAYITIYHGVMIGAFHALFAQYGELEQSLLTVWIHGATEISMLIVSAAAGLSIGLSVLNPGTYPRREAFVQALRRAALVAVGIVPLVIFAAFLESFVTRQTDMPLILNILVILLTGAGVVWYLWVLPTTLLKRSLRGITHH